MLDHGADIRAVQELLGHASIEHHAGVHAGLHRAPAQRVPAPPTPGPRAGATALNVADVTDPGTWSRPSTTDGRRGPRRRARAAASPRSVSSPRRRRSAETAVTSNFADWRPGRGRAGREHGPGRTTSGSSSTTSSTPSPSSTPAPTGSCEVCGEPIAERPPRGHAGHPVLHAARRLTAARMAGHPPGHAGSSGRCGPAGRRGRRRVGRGQLLARRGRAVAVDEPGRPPPRGRRGPPGRGRRSATRPTRPVLAAALLHDVGKTESGLGTYGRVDRHPLRRGGRPRPRHVRPGPAPRGFTRRVGLYLQHPSSAATCSAWPAATRSPWPGPASTTSPRTSGRSDRDIGDALKAADDD